MSTAGTKKTSMDMCNGPLFSKIVLFSIPVMLSNMLQLLYNAADQIVVGQFAGSDALGAVGSTSSLFHLIVCLVIGLSVGASSIVARYFGARDNESVSRAVHSSMLLSVISGAIIGIAGFFSARPLLILMKTQPDILDSAVLYMQILFAGLPLVSVYNFGSAVLRAIGDTKRPLYYLIISGVINVVLNIIFVAGFKMSVEGVALATVISQTIAGIMVVIWLMKSEGSYKLIPSKLRLYKNECIQIIQLGIPAGIQSSMFSFSNIIMQSSINSISKAAVSGCTAASTLDNLIYQAMNSLYHASLAFCGQNYGAKKPQRIMRSFLCCSGIVTVIGLVIGTGVHIFAEPLLCIFIKDNPEAIVHGIERLRLTCIPYFLCGLMEVSGGALRSMNHSIMTLINSVLGACVFRIIWVYTVFAASPSIHTLFISYPVSWTITTTLHTVGFMLVYLKMKKSTHPMSDTPGGDTDKQNDSQDACDEKIPENQI